MPNREADDVKAIRQVMADESAAFWNKDYEAWARCWVHAPYVRRVGWWSLGGVTYRAGWEQLSERTRELLAANPAPNPTAAGVRLENVNLRISKDMAWVTYDQYGTDTGEPDMDMPGLSRETKILEKHDGTWKLVYVGYLHRSTHHVDAAVIGVDRSAVVVWQNTSARAALRDGCGLVIHSGRLRARNRTADQRLQAAIRWAARLDDGLDARRGNIPIVLEGGRGLPANVCWVTADSGMVLVSINDRELAAERLEAASLVYGISHGQRRLAAEIIAGHDLTQSAERLGISVNTARTHLQRMFDKTGVRSQPALVRALLSLAAPSD